MKNPWLILLFLTLPIFAFPQDTIVNQPSRNIYLDFNLGAAVPLGSKYTSGDVNDENAGFATTGLFLQAAVQFVGKSDFGIGFQFAYQSNGINEGAQDDTLDKMMTPLGSDNWQNYYLMGGPVYLKKINPILTVNAMATAGFIISSSPVFSMTNPETKEREDKTGTGFALGISAGIGIKVARNLSLKVDLGYKAGFPSVSKEYAAYPYWDYNLNKILYTAPVEYDISKTVSTFNGGVGILISL